MPVEGATISFEDVEKKFAVIPVKDLDETKAFLDGDHWQKGDGWIGWRPLVTSGTSEKDFELIERGFTPKNVIKGMTKRLRGAVLGKEPDWEVVSINRPDPTVPAPDTDKKERSPEEEYWHKVDQTVTQWWAEKKAHNVLKDFIENYAAFGKASIQIYIPKGYVKMGADGSATLNFTGTDLASVLSKIYVMAPGYSSVINVKDDDFGEEYVILRLKKKEDSDDTVYEIHYVDEQKKTHIRQVSQSKTDSKTAEKKLSVDLGGNLLTYVAGEYTNAMISEPVKQQQKQLNHAKTMEGYALANINFPETTFINADLETEKGKNANGESVDVVKPLWRGVNAFLNLVGYTTQNSDGSETLVTPQVIYKPQADPEKFAKVAENNTRDMHQEAGMVYILLSSSPYPSGESRIESMTDYLILLVDYKTLADTVGYWLINTVLRLALGFTPDAVKANKFDVVFSSKLTIGRVSTEDKTIMLEEVKQRLRSRRNYMITCEVTDDPTLELGVITAEPILEPLATEPPPPVDPNAAKKPMPASK